MLNFSPGMLNILNSFHKFKISHISVMPGSLYGPNFISNSKFMWIITIVFMRNTTGNYWIHQISLRKMCPKPQLRFTYSKSTLKILENTIYYTRNTRCKICSKLKIKTAEQCHWRCSGVFTVNFEHVLHLFLVFLLLTLNNWVLSYIYFRVFELNTEISSVKNSDIYSHTFYAFPSFSVLIKMWRSK